MNALAGSARLVRLVVRRDRLRLSIWVVAIVGLVGFSAQSVLDLYATEAELADYAATVDTNAALVAISGPAEGLDTFGGRIAWESWLYGAAIALMAILTVVRHTRADEEAGRTELVRSGIVGRHAHSAAAVGVAIGVCAVIGAGSAAVLAGLDLPVTGSVALGAAFAGIGIVFAGVGLLAAQLTSHARTATGIGAALLSTAFVVRAVGDVSNGAVSWLSPFGWMQATRPYTGDRVLPLVLSLAAAALLVVGAVAMERRRDVGAGLVADRGGPAAAGPRLGSPVGLAWVLHRGSLGAWTTGMFLGGAAFGGIADSADDLVGDNEAILDYLADVGGASLSELFVATLVVYFALLAGAYGISAANRLRTEEAAGRTEMLVATPTSRSRWAWGHVLLAVGGTSVVLAAAGLGLGLTYGATTGDVSDGWAAFSAAMTYLPATWVLVAFAAAVHGAASRLFPALWAFLAGCVVIGTFGDGFDIPQPIQDLSPFEHPGLAPATAPDVFAGGVLLAISAITLVVGHLGLVRRDLSGDAT